MKLGFQIAKLQEEIKIKDEVLKEKANHETKEVDESEIESLKTKHEQEIKDLTAEHESEVEKLRGILAEIRETGSNSLLIHEIEQKHKNEMEELRTYFEQKCAEVEKQ